MTVTTVVQASLSVLATTPHPPALPKHRGGAPTWLHCTTLFHRWLLLLFDKRNGQRARGDLPYNALTTRLSRGVLVRSLI